MLSAMTFYHCQFLYAVAVVHINVISWKWNIIFMFVYVPFSAWKMIFNYNFHFILQCALDTSYWTGFNHFVIWGSIIYYFCFHLAFYSDGIRYTYSGVAFQIFSQPIFWLCMLITSTLLLLPVVAYRFYTANIKPTLSDRVRLQQRMTKAKFRPRPEEAFRRRSTLRRSSRSIRSGYAFAHQSGFGELITSGMSIKDRASSRNRSVILTNIRALNSMESDSSKLTRRLEAHRTVNNNNSNPRTNAPVARSNGNVVTDRTDNNKNAGSNIVFVEKLWHKLALFLYSCVWLYVIKLAKLYI